MDSAPSACETSEKAGSPSPIEEIDFGKLADIEVLRALAVMLTVIGHFGELLPWGGPWVVWVATALWGGVDLFFCISGFVIARSLLREPMRGKSAVHFVEFAVPFWIKRIFRIWPAAFLWIFIALVCTVFTNESGVYGTFRTNLVDSVAAVLQVSNWHYLSVIHYRFSEGNTVQGIYWSLSLEEQFYLVFPFILFLLPRKYLVPVLLVGVAAQFPISRATWDVFWACRTDAIMLGVILAATCMTPAYKRLEPVFLRGKWLPYLGFALGAFFIAYVPSDAQMVTFTTGLLAVLCAGMVFVASFNKGYTLPEGWIKRIAVYIGSRSYALYLAHNSLYFLTRELFYRWDPGVTFDSTYDISFILVALPMSFICAELTFRFVETPLRLLGRRKAAQFREEGMRMNPASA